MALVIREMCFDDRQEVQALLRAAQGDGDSAEQDGSLPAEKILQGRSTLSLVACEEGKIVGTMVCDREGQCGYLHHLPQDPSQPCDDVAKALVDKIMRKLNARGVGTFRIDLPQGASGNPFWDEVKWGSVTSPGSKNETAQFTDASLTAGPVLEESGPVTEPQAAQ